MKLDIQMLRNTNWHLGVGAGGGRGVTSGAGGGGGVLFSSAKTGKGVAGQDRECLDDKALPPYSHHKQKVE